MFVSKQLAIGIVGLAGAAAAAWPVGFTAASVVLLAGPHAAIELRYALARMPARCGPLARFFALAAAGLAALSAGMIALTLALRCGALDASHAPAAYALWLALTVVWAALLAAERARTPPRREWSRWVPFSLCLIGLAWLAPLECTMALVYLHPLVSFAVLDREVARTRPAAVSAYRAALGTVPVVVVCVFVAVAAGSAPPAEAGELAPRILLQSGSGYLPQLPARALVAVHGLLELLHYLAWLVAIPLASAPRTGRILPIPLERRSPRARRAVRRLLGLSLAGMAALWAGFAMSPGATWDLYFTLAIVHVLAEIPMLVRLL